MFELVSSCRFCCNPTHSLPLDYALWTVHLKKSYQFLVCIDSVFGPTSRFILFASIMYFSENNMEINLKHHNWYFRSILDTFKFNVLQEKMTCIQCVETQNATYMSPNQAHEDVTINSKLFLGMSLLGANTLQNGLVITSTP